MHYPETVVETADAVTAQIVIMDIVKAPSTEAPNGEQ